MTYNRARHLLKMRDAKRIVAELGGSWRYNNRAEIVFEHPLCDTHVISKGNRLETNDKLTTWIRNLARAREELRIAFGFDERRESA